MLIMFTYLGNNICLNPEYMLLQNNGMKRLLSPKEKINNIMIILYASHRVSITKFYNISNHSLY